MFFSTFIFINLSAFRACFHPAYETVIHTEYQVPSVVAT